MTKLRIAELFPAGGPVRPDLVIGRQLELSHIVQNVDEGISLLLSGPRRIGKTTLGDAACAALASRMTVIPRVEVPEHRSDCADLLRALTRSYLEVSRREELAAVGRIVRPLIEAWLKERKLPVDLSADNPRTLSSREILELPVRLARETKKPVLVFIDELQRIAEAEDRDAFLTDLVDLYSQAPQVVVLVDGSDERLINKLMASSAHLAKLFTRQAVDLQIPRQQWRPALTDRFAQAVLPIDSGRLERILDFGAERPYETMLACQCVAMAGRAMGSQDIGDFEIQQGLADAQRRLEDA